MIGSKGIKKKWGVHFQGGPNQLSDYKNDRCLQLYQSNSMKMAVLRNDCVIGQLKKADNHSITSWHYELEITKALRIAHDDENRNDEATALEKLGDIYYARACLKDEPNTLFARLDQFILATALYNSSLIRGNDETKKIQIKEKLRQIERNLISHCGKAINKSEFQHDIDKNHTKKLKVFRQRCCEKMQKIQSKYCVSTSPLHGTDVESEAKRGKEIKELFNEIHEFLKEAVTVLLDECIKILEQPPEDVSYAFIGFGSFARREATPYSDIESALLIEEGKNSSLVKEYFVKLLEYFNYKVLNLQETILPSMCIPSLNDENDLIHSLERYKCSSCSCTRPDNIFDASEWPFLQKGFYDDETRGLSVDGRMGKACKTPLGRLVTGRGQSKDLIKTPTELAQLYFAALKCDRSTAKEENYNLSTVLSNVSFLYGNDEELVDIYNALVFSTSEISDDDTTLSHRQSSAVHCLQTALDQFQFSLTSKDMGIISSIKKKLYRAVGMLITNIGKFQYSTVVDNSPWNILNRLRDDIIISASAYRNLSMVVTIANELRLMAYLRCGRQDEIFSFLDQSHDINMTLVRDLCTRFFYTVFPFQRSVRKILAKLQSRETTTIQFRPNEKFYEYSHFNSAIALTFTSVQMFNEMREKFAQAYSSAENENMKRLCLAYLSCLDPDYSSKFTEKMVACIGDGNDCERRIFAYLTAALASFHQDDVPKIEKFLDAAIATSKSDIFVSDSMTVKTLRAYSKLISGFLKFRQRSYHEALVEFNSARMFYMMQFKGNVGSLFETETLFMTGYCHIMLGKYEDPNVEIAMHKVRDYTGNGDYMFILYHIYMVALKGGENDQEITKHFEKILELFMRFRCPKGQEVWASILGQGIILVALYLGLLYRNMQRVDDAFRIFRLASSHLVAKAFKLCGDGYHVGKIEAEKARKCVDAFIAIFKFSEAECLHFKGRKDEMWECISTALTKLANCRGKFEQIDQQDVFAEANALERFNLRGRGSLPVYRTNENRQHAAPRFIDALSMHPLLQCWCDTLTRELQFILYTTERDITQQILQQGTPIVLASCPQFLPRFIQNPCKFLLNLIPVVRPDGMINEIFSKVNSQRTAAFKLIKTNLCECQQYAVLTIGKKYFSSFFDSHCAMIC